MLSRLWDALEAYFKDKAYWEALRPLFGLVSLYLVVLVTVYEYIEWQYQVSTPPALFLRSYLFRQVSIGFLAFGALLYVLRPRRPPGEERSPAVWQRLLRGVGAWRIVLAVVIAALAVVAVAGLRPARARHVKMRFLSDTTQSFDRNAFVYLLYELNRQQRHWYFEVDLDTFDPSELTSEDRTACADDPMCYARHVAEGEPLVGITTEPLRSASFWQNDATTSVITTHEWADLAPPSVYEYLVHAVIVQSMLIHLNAQCSGLPAGAFRSARQARGSLFEFAPRRQAMKAEIMAAHLTPQDEELLLNCLGVEYMTTCANLLTLDWMRIDRMKDNLERAFGVSLEGAPAGP